MLYLVQMSFTDTSLDVYSAFIFRLALGVTLAGLPPMRPRARAATRPARVRSLMVLRSNSASAENR